MPEMTLAEYERRCLEGDLESITPDDISWAVGYAARLGMQFHQRLLSQASKWEKPRKPRGGGLRIGKAAQAAACFSGMEHSLPASDRE